MSNNFDSVKAAKEPATIGPSITIKGEISGAEDLLIEGVVEGTVNLKENTITIGKTATVNADTYGKVIRVEGQVNGDLFGQEQVIVYRSGCVNGNITAPRLSLEDGARLKGSVNTEHPSGDAPITLSIEKVYTAAATAAVQGPAPRQVPEAAAKQAAATARSAAV